MSFWKSYELAVDFGSSNTAVSIKGRGVVFNEPTVIAINTKSKKVIAIGHKAKNMLGREHADIAVIKPVERGIIKDVKAAQIMIHCIISQCLKGTLLKPSVMLCAPKNITETDKKTFSAAFCSAGAKKVHIVPSPVSTAMGNGLNVTNPSGRLIVNFGGGICEISIVTLGTVAGHSQLDIGSMDFDRKIIDYIKNTYEILIGEITAEKIKTSIGSVLENDDEEFFIAKGKSLSTGLPSVARITSGEIKHIFLGDAKKIAEEIRDVVTKAPAELVSDVEKYGIIITGNGSRLKGFKELIDSVTGLKSSYSADILCCTVAGAQKASDQKETLIKTGVI